MDVTGDICCLKLSWEQGECMYVCVHSAAESG